MPQLRAWIKASIGTWILLTATTALATAIYFTFDTGQNDGMAVTTALIVAGIVMLTARMLEPLSVSGPNLIRDLKLTWSEIASFFKRSGAVVGSGDETLRLAFRALNLEGVTDFRVANPVGETALLMRISPTANHPLVISELLPHLGADPLTVRTIWFVEGDDSVVVATFAREISQLALERARKVVLLAKIARIPNEEAARLLRSTDEELAAYATSAAA